SVPYRPWISGLEAGYWELPTVFQDAHVRLGRYKIMKLEDAKHLAKKFIQNTLRTRGIFGLDLSLASYTDIPYCAKLYSYILALIKTDGIWLTTAAEIADWWEKRNRITIEEAEYEISVYFPDALEDFSLQVLNDVKIKEIEGLPASLEGSLVRFSNIPAGRIAVIRLDREA
ncbi:MAG: hypothetical protein ACP5F3_01975, partial [Candidatus Syntrophosphaera sp.]